MFLFTKWKNQLWVLKLKSLKMGRVMTKSRLKKKETKKVVTKLENSWKKVQQTNTSFDLRIVTYCR